MLYNVRNIYEYRVRESLLETVWDELGDCRVYLLNTPLLPDATFPKGMKLEEHLLFETEDSKYQIAYEKRTIGGSYMLLNLEGNPINFKGMPMNQHVN